MTTHADINVHLSDAPTVRVHRSTAVADRAVMSLGDTLTVFAPTDTLRATLTAALEQLDAITGGAQ